MTSRGRKQAPRLKPRFRLWIENEKCTASFGDGKWRLLEAIDATGSLKAAADALGMSYRKAWGDLRSAEAAVGQVLLERRRGGRCGGETRLTKEGKRWVKAYARFRARVEAALLREFGLDSGNEGGRTCLKQS